MQSRRDRVMAHNFTVGRLGTAMLEGDPDAVDAPMRRTRTGTYIGIAIGVVLCIGFLVFGLIFPGGATSWRQEGRLIVDRDTGATYMYSAGVLRPVANGASARLVQGADAAVSLVSARSLEGVPVGGPVGIAAAPDSLPTEAGLEESVWRVCALSPQDEDGEIGRTALVVGDAQEPVSPSAGQGVLVAGPDGAQHLLWNGTRLRLDEERGAVQALGYGTSSVLPVTSAFLNTVPTGPDLTAIDVPGAGDDGGDLAGEPRRVGQVFAVSTPGQGDQHYLLTGDGLVPLSMTQALLLLAAPDVSGAAYPDSPAEALPLPAGEAHARLSDGPAPREELHPGAPPELVGVGASVPCLRLTPEGSLSLTMDDPAGVDAWPVQERPGIAPGCPTPDLVGIASGRGTLAAAQPVGGSGVATTHYLVTDSAAKYPVVDENALTALGYETAQSVPVPTSLLRLLPSGPVLDPEAAALPLASSSMVEDAGCP
jgi:type VII secretion protein EccB